MIIMSGYTYCACRDCMDIAISNVYNGRRLQPVLCENCREAGCVNADVNMDGYQYDCQRDDAYEGAPECEGHYDTDDALTSGVGIGEPVYCDGSCVL